MIKGTITVYETWRNGYKFSFWFPHNRWTLAVDVFDKDGNLVARADFLPHTFQPMFGAPPKMPELKEAIEELRQNEAWQVLVKMLFTFPDEWGYIRRGVYL